MNQILRFVVLCMCIIALSGCGIAKEVSNANAYKDGFLTYISQVQEFNKNMTTLLNSQTYDETTVKNIVAEEKKMQANINAFNSLEPPAVVQSLHEQVVGYNEIFNTFLSTTITGLEAGTLTMDKIKEEYAKLDVVSAISNSKDKVLQEITNILK